MKIIDFYAGMSIDAAHKELCEESKRCKEPVAGEFNTKVISSDMTLEECYIKVTGKTKEQVEADQKAFKEKYEREERERKERIPALVEEYKEKAKGLVKEEEWDYFVKILPIRVGDLYHGFEIQSMIEIITILRDNKDNKAEAIVKSREKFENQGHSGMSAGLVASLVKRFSSWLGMEF